MTSGNAVRPGGDGGGLGWVTGGGGDLLGGWVGLCE